MRVAITSCLCRTALTGFLLVSTSGAYAGEAQVPLPKPKQGLIITHDELTAIRAKITNGVPEKIWGQVVAQLPKAVAGVAELRARAWPPRRSAWDEGQQDAKEIIAISEAYMKCVPLIATHYLMTGKTEGVEDALWCMRQLRHYDRVGWFTWSGGSFPQIRYGGVVRVTAYCYDWLYGAMDDATRTDIEAFLVTAARDYFRIDLIGPGMLMHHLRHHNQGNNAFCSGMAATLVTRDVNPDASRWLRAYVETYLWNLNNAFGPNGEGLEGDLAGYWGISLDALTQAAIMLRNTLGVDFLDHPHLRNAHTYWLAHLAPCNPVVYLKGSQKLDTPYDETYAGYSWVHDAPASTVHKADPSNTLLFYARRLSDAGSLDLWLRSKLRSDGNVAKQTLDMPHTGTLGAFLALSWYPEALVPRKIEGPLHHFSTQLGMLRTGLVPGVDSLLTFNGGQLNLIERGEQFGTGVGLVWHHPHYHYANAQNTLWTEGIDLQPGYSLTASYDGTAATFFSSKGAFSNTHYYPHREQLDAHKNFDTLERDILRVGNRYWVFLDRVAQPEAKSHTFTWNALNTDRQASYTFGKNSATLVRRQSALDFRFAEPASVSFRQNQTQIMPVWNFSWSGHGLALYAQAGEKANDVAETRRLNLRDFEGAKVVGTDIVVPLGLKPGEDLGKGGVRSFPASKRWSIRGGHYYTLELDYSHANAMQYREPAWQLLATFFDADGKPLNKPDWRNPTSACLTELDGEVAELGPVTARRRFAVPSAARSVAFELQTWHFNFLASSHLRNAPDRESTLTLHAARLLRHAPPERKKSTRFVTIIQSRDKEAPPLATRTDTHATGSVTRFDSSVGTDIVVSGEGPITDKAGLFISEGRLGALTLTPQGILSQAFLERFTRFESKVLGLVLQAGHPVTLEVDGTNVTLKCTQSTDVEFTRNGATLTASLDKGYHRLVDGTFRLDATRFDAAVETPPQDLASYHAAVAPYHEALQADVQVPALGENLLRDASFRASSVLEERFAPALVGDGRIVEAYGDGRIHYNEPGILSAPREGYSGNGHNGWYLWPYHTRPTYWLAKAEEVNAWIEAELPKTQPITTVRLQNTSNAGFNDRAMLEFRIDLFDAAGKVVKSVTDGFGKPFPESVSYPGQTYMPTWRFWFEPQTPIPHGEGFKTVELGGSYDAKRIRVTCLRYWGYGAGLNELQAFGPLQTPSIPVVLPVQADSSVPPRLEVAAIFADQMVLQRDMPIPVWGWAAPGEKVSVTLGDHREEGTADEKGAWRVTLPAVAAGGPHSLKITGGTSDRTLSITDILMGDVWICGGQSNMQWPLNNAKDAATEIASACYPEFRSFYVTRVVSTTPRDRLTGKWTSAGPKTVGNWSGVGYFFGRELHKTLQVPIGLIDINWGGTFVEAWTSRAKLETFSNIDKELAYYRSQLDQYAREQAAARDGGSAKPSNETSKSTFNPHGPNQYAGPYNGTIHPLIPFAIKGVVWYQGENNRHNPQRYRERFTGMIQDWRDRWGQGDFPFYWVQLANYDLPTAQPRTSAWADVRQAQTESLALTNTAQALAIDLADSDNPLNIHPRNKQDVGHRLALLARRNLYGETALVAEGPILKQWRVEGGHVIVEFDPRAEGELVVRDGGDIRGFLLAGADRRWFRATAQLTSATTVRLHSEQVSEPVAVRFAYEDNPDLNLYNGAGLPAEPFRTDDWNWPALPKR